MCRCLDIHINKGKNEPNATVACQKLGAGETALYPLEGKGSRIARVVSESGLYKLIMRSDKPVAKPFQDWVTEEVLPSVRKTGGYLLNEDMRETAAADNPQDRERRAA